MSTRVRVRSPSPHDTEQGLQLPHRETLQSTGQGAAPQLRWLNSTGHAKPPCCENEVTVRMRVLRPPPHVRLQADHAPQGETWQWKGHGPSEQTFDSVSAGQEAPPRSISCSDSRTRLLVPVPPQVSEHAPHAPQPLTAQSTAQDFALHACISVAALHGLPKKAPRLAGSCSTVRERDWVPEPQLSVQGDHNPHADCTQS